MQPTDIFTLQCDFELTIHFRLVKINLKYLWTLTVEKGGRT